MGFTALEWYFDDVGSNLEGKPIWEVRTRYWKLREGENRLSVLLEGIPHVVERAVTRPWRPRVSRGLDLSKMLSEP
ncbi:hypothetical protein GQ457_11G032460 [Hibiscus cannabinus]